MIGESRVLALIPARAGSKGLPGKNIRQLHGKPLLAWSGGNAGVVKAAAGVAYCDSQGLAVCGSGGGVH